MIAKLLTGALALGLLLILLFIGLSIYSRNAPAIRSADAGLRPCPDTPNCVSSVESGQQWSVAPLHYSGDARAAWERISQVVTESGGRIIQEDPGYLRAEFQTPVFRFVDEVELRLEERSNSIQIRSASRVGYSDRGANRQRVEMLRQRFEATE